MIVCTCIFFQNLQSDIYPIKEPDSDSFQSRILINNNSTAVCSMHNIAMILPQDSTQLIDSSRYKTTNSKVCVSRYIKSLII